jgi:hypothetical protein
VCVCFCLCLVLGDGASAGLYRGEQSNLQRNSEACGERRQQPNMPSAEATGEKSIRRGGVRGVVALSRRSHKSCRSQQPATVPILAGSGGEVSGARVYRPVEARADTGRGDQLTRSCDGCGGISTEPTR